jgi:DNA-binding protein HU-beta
MAKPLTKSQVVSAVAETVGLTKKQSAATIEALVNLAYKNAKNSFTIPGLGKLVLVNRKARMGRNPATGETIRSPPSAWSNSASPRLPRMQSWA